jgi:hypothetical protein
MAKKVKGFEDFNIEDEKLNLYENITQSNTSKCLTDILNEIKRKSDEEAIVKIKEYVEPIAIEIEDIFREVQDYGIQFKIGEPTFLQAKLMNFDGDDEKFPSKVVFNSYIQFKTDDLEKKIEVILDTIERVELAEGISPKMSLAFANKEENIDPLSDRYSVRNGPKKANANDFLGWAKENLIKNNAKVAFITIKW